jgi:hypothetical protein
MEDEMNKIDCTQNRWKNAKDAISVMCPKCKTVQELSHLSGWSFIILKETICKNKDCKAKITHDDIIKDED